MWLLQNWLCVCKVQFVVIRGEGMEIKSILIKDTTKEECEAIVKNSMDGKRSFMEVSEDFK